MTVRPNRPKLNNHTAAREWLLSRWFAAVALATATVRTELTDPAPGVMEAGENEQVSPLGKLGQDRAMALLKAPDCAAAVTVTFPDPPEGIVMDEGFVANDTVVLPAQCEVNFTGAEIV